MRLPLIVHPPCPCVGVGHHKRFTDAELAAEAWRQDACVLYIRQWPWYTDDIEVEQARLKIIDRFVKTPSYDERTTP